jgi:cytochrome c biogenesis protein CcmG/thiol:disulfide interchange protein DsbE
VTRALLGVLALLASLALAGCGPSTVDGAAPSSPSAGTCLPPAPSSPVASPSGAVVQRIPDLALECFDGGGRVRLAALHRPAIVNLWASWCAPCRAELPAFQSFATAAGDRVTVLGVDTGDTRTAGGALLSDLKVSYPTLYDDQRRLLTSVGRTALPVTLFVDADGGIRYVYNSTPLDDAGIAGLARTYLGVG